MKKFLPFIALLFAFNAWAADFDAANTDRNIVFGAETSGNYISFDASTGTPTMTGTGTNYPTPKCYGELYDSHPGSTAITVAAAGTYYQWVNSTVGIESGNGFVDCDATTDDCIVESASCAGTYLVILNTSFSGANSAIVNCAIAVNDTEDTTKKIFERKLGVAGTDVGSAPATGLVTLANGDAVTVECTSDTNGDTVTPHTLNMVMHKIAD